MKLLNDGCSESWLAIGCSGGPRGGGDDRGGRRVLNDDEEKVRAFVPLIVLLETLGVLESGGGKLLTLFEDGAGERKEGAGMVDTEGGGLCVFGV